MCIAHARRPTCEAKTVILDVLPKLQNLNSFLLTLDVGNMNLCHCTPPPVTLALGHKVSGKPHLLHLFLSDVSVDQDEILCVFEAVQVELSDFASQ